ncbi:MAG: ABC transporter substrate-binding protein [Defluviitaleaceae bacterium]|nr:ABC transporter substrate-binding protein [Defluviitaleaceae bacterium]
MKKTLSLLGAFAFAVTLASCGAAMNGETENGYMPATVNYNGTNEAIVWVTAADPPTLDTITVNHAATTDVATQIFERLIWFSPYTGELEPLLAESVEIIDEDLLVYEFILRQGVYFHDGTPFNAYAVKRSLDRLLDPANASPAAFILDMIDTIEIVDDYTVHIILEFPFTPFLSHLVHRGASIVSPAAIDEEERGERTVSENPIGTGPFIFSYRVDGEYVRLVPNENHWRSVPYHDLIFQAVPSSSTRLAMVQSGEANVLRGVATYVNELQNSPNVYIVLQPSTGLTYMGFNVSTEGPLSDARVRRAISMAINKEDILNGVQEGIGQIAVGPVRVGNVAYAPAEVEQLPYDLELARELLAEAGFADGFSTTISLATGNPVLAMTAELIQAKLSQLNIDVTIEAAELATYLANTAAGVHEIFIMSWTTITGDADYGIFPLFHSSEIGATNRMFYSNPLVDELLEEARQSTDSNRRAYLYRQITEILVYESPMVFLFHPNTPIITNGVEGFFTNINDTPYFFNTRLN